MDKCRKCEKMKRLFLLCPLEHWCLVWRNKQNSRFSAGSYFYLFPYTPLVNKQAIISFPLLLLWLLTIKQRCPNYQLTNYVLYLNESNSMIEKNEVHFNRKCLHIPNELCRWRHNTHCFSHSSVVNVCLLIKRVM